MGHFNNIVILGDNTRLFTRLLQGCYKVVYKVVTRLLQGCYQVVTMSIAYL